MMEDKLPAKSQLLRCIIREMEFAPSSEFGVRIQNVQGT